MLHNQILAHAFQNRKMLLHVRFGLWKAKTEDLQFVDDGVKW